MRIKKSILTAIFLASTVLCTWSGNAQAQMFEFRVCNQSNVSASVAVSYPVAKGDEVKGWWIVNAGDCETIGSFPQGPFYFFAEQTGHGNLHWEGGASTCRMPLGQISGFPQTDPGGRVSPRF
jgi:uncharacterized membrane protein